MKIKLDPNFFPDSETVIISAIDPGQTTGIAMVLLGKSATPGLWEAKFCTRTYEWPKDAQALRDVELTLSDVVICEQWVFQPAKSRLKNWQSAIEVKGFVRGELATMGNLNRLHFQTPAQKEYAVVDTLNAFPGDLGVMHEWDAARHLVYFLQQGKNGKH